MRLDGKPVNQVTNETNNNEEKMKEKEQVRKERFINHDISWGEGGGKNIILVYRIKMIGYY